MKWCRLKRTGSKQTYLCFLSPSPSSLELLRLCFLSFLLSFSSRFSFFSFFLFFFFSFSKFSRNYGERKQRSARRFVTAERSGVPWRAFRRLTILRISFILTGLVRTLLFFSSSRLLGKDRRDVIRRNKQICSSGIYIKEVTRRLAVTIKGVPRNQDIRVQDWSLHSLRNAFG